MMNEFELIDFLTKKLPRKTRGLAFGIGDDCAVINGEKFDWLFTADSLIEKIHFDFRHTSAADLGRKALSVNLSDVAAMGGMPLYFTVSIGVPRHISAGTLKKIYDGIAEVADRSGCVMAGGDTSASEKGLFISIALIGKIKRKRAVLRSGAAPGDFIYVSGTLGDAALALQCARRKKGKCGRYFLDRLNNPSARIKLGMIIAKNGFASSMIDVSDGLLADIGHIADSSGTGFVIDAASVPVSADFLKYAKRYKFNPPALALSGGDDYELVFTVPRRRQKIFEKNRRKIEKRAGCRISLIGRIIKDKRKRAVLGRDGKVLAISDRGYDHFKEV
jgi:thiamine-monophosphate kinase